METFLERQKQNLRVIRAILSNADLFRSGLVRSMTYESAEVPRFRGMPVAWTLGMQPDWRFLFPLFCSDVSQLVLLTQYRQRWSILAKGVRLLAVFFFHIRLSAEPMLISYMFQLYCKPMGWALMFSFLRNSLSEQDSIPSTHWDSHSLPNPFFRCVHHPSPAIQPHVNPSHTATLNAQHSGNVFPHRFMRLSILTGVSGRSF